MTKEDEPICTISFYCSCGECLYTVGTTHCSAMLWTDKCVRCGQHYVCTDSLIAYPVSSARVARAALLKAKRNLPIDRTQRQPA
jgi:hypothetical protein